MQQIEAENRTTIRAIPKPAKALCETPILSQKYNASIYQSKTQQKSVQTKNKLNFENQKTPIFKNSKTHKQDLFSNNLKAHSRNLFQETKTINFSHNQNNPSSTRPTVPLFRQTKFENTLYCPPKLSSFGNQKESTQYDTNCLNDAKNLTSTTLYKPPTKSNPLSVTGNLNRKNEKSNSISKNKTIKKNEQENKIKKSSSKTIKKSVLIKQDPLVANNSIQCDQFYLKWLVEGSSNSYFQALRFNLESTLHAKASIIQKNFRGYFVRKLIEQRYNCGFCKKFKQKTSILKKADKIAAKIVETNQIEKENAKIFAEKLRNFEFDLDENQMGKSNNKIDNLDFTKACFKDSKIIPCILLPNKMTNFLKGTIYESELNKIIELEKLTEISTLPKLPNKIIINSVKKITNSLKAESVK